MDSTKSKYLKAFNNQFMEFVEDVMRLYPDNKNLVMTKNIFIAAKKTNPKMLCRIWQKYVVIKYHKQILEGNTEFFIEKDYTSDLVNYEYGSKVVDRINDMRDLVRNEDNNNKEMTMKYLVNLCTLSNLYWDNMPPPY